jgi:hypothetical protein
MESKACVVSKDLMQTLVRYLETKPFTEVHGLIAWIMKEANAVVPAPEPEPEQAKVE